MELIVYVIAPVATGSFFYLFLCSPYFAFTSRSQLAARRLCWKLALVTIVGIPLAELKKSPCYRQVRDLLTSLSIAAICSVGIYFSLISLAFSILD